MILGVVKTVCGSLKVWNSVSWALVIAFQVFHVLKFHLNLCSNNWDWLQIGRTQFYYVLGDGGSQRKGITYLNFGHDMVEENVLWESLEPGPLFVLEVRKKVEAKVDKCHLIVFEPLWMDPRGRVRVCLKKKRYYSISAEERKFGAFLQMIWDRGRWF